MQTSFSLSLAAAALLLGCIVACNDGTAPGTASAADAQLATDTQVTADIAPSAGEDIATEAEFYGNASASPLTGSLSLNTPMNATSSGSLALPVRSSLVWISPFCHFRVSTRFFYCQPVVVQNYHIGSRTVSRTDSVDYELFDVNGVSQSAYNDTTTASIHLFVFDSSAVLFTWNQNSYADTSSHRRDATLSNLQGRPDTLHIWNSTGASSIASIRSGEITKSYRLTSSDTTTELEIRQPRGLNPYPLSGTIIRNYTVVRTRQASDTTTHTMTRRVMVTFNGSADVPMMVGNTQYMLNIDTHQVTKQ